MNTDKQIANYGLPLLKQRREGRKSLRQFEIWLEKEVAGLSARFESEMSELNELIEEAEQAIRDHEKIESGEDTDFKQSLETNRDLFSSASAALASLREEKVQLEKKIAEVVDNNSIVQNFRLCIAGLKKKHGFTD